MDHKLEQDEKAKKAMEEELDKEHGVMFKKRELIFIFNVFTSINMKYGDFVLAEPILKKIEPIVAIASNIPPKTENPQLIGVKEEN